MSPTTPKVHRLACVSLVLSCSLMTSCSAFRAQIGVGFGLGAIAHIPAVAKVSPLFGGGGFYHIGHDYGRGWCLGTGHSDTKFDTALNFIAYHEEEQSDTLFKSSVQGGYVYVDYSYRDRFRCLPAPTLTGSPEGTYHPWSLELDVFLLFLDIRLGFNPWFLSDHDSETKPAAATP